jgi:hypothetical protein
MIENLDKQAEAILDSIYAQKQFQKKSLKLEPNAVYLGKNEFYILKAYSKWFLHVDKDCAFKIFDMNVYGTIYENHLSVGVIDDITYLEDYL